MNSFFMNTIERHICSNLQNLINYFIFFLKVLENCYVDSHDINGLSKISKLILNSINQLVVERKFLTVTGKLLKRGKAQQGKPVENFTCTSNKSNPLQELLSIRLKGLRLNQQETPSSRCLTVDVCKLHFRLCWEHVLLKSWLHKVRENTHFAAHTLSSYNLFTGRH